MADFAADFTDGATVEPWNDPATVSLPSRLNPFPEHPHRRWVGEVGTEVEISATVDGDVAPMDVDLDDSNLFKLSFTELPQLPPPSKSSPAGQSSVWRFTPPVVGHYTLIMRRREHGQVILHLDVQA
jgi:hypothetical protein